MKIAHNIIIFAAECTVHDAHGSTGQHSSSMCSAHKLRGHLVDRSAADATAFLLTVPTACMCNYKMFPLMYPNFIKHVICYLNYLS